MKIRIGIDNGVSGSIGIIEQDGTSDFHTMKQFTHKEQDYTKRKKGITRLKAQVLHQYLYRYVGDDVKVLIERPMVNPKHFNTTVCAVRIMEATMNVLELLKFGYEFIDSREWQKELLPQGTKGSSNLKKASLDVGSKLFPHFRTRFKTQKDADGMLIAEYCRRKYKL